MRITYKGKNIDVTPALKNMRKRNWDGWNELWRSMM